MDFYLSESDCHSRTYPFICKCQPGVNFINVIPAHFSYKIFGAKTSKTKHSFIIFGTKISCKKCARKTLMKMPAKSLKEKAAKSVCVCVCVCVWERERRGHPTKLRLGWLNVREDFSSGHASYPSPTKQDTWANDVTRNLLPVLSIWEIRLIIILPFLNLR